MKRTMFVFMAMLGMIICLSGCGVAGNAEDGCCGGGDVKNDCCKNGTEAVESSDVIVDVPDCCGG